MSTIIYWTDPCATETSALCHARCADCNEQWVIPYLARVEHQCKRDQESLMATRVNEHLMWRVRIPLDGPWGSVWPERSEYGARAKADELRLLGAAPIIECTQTVWVEVPDDHEVLDV